MGSCRSVRSRCWPESLYLTCDGASPNRRFFELHGDDRPAWYMENIMDPTRNIYFISDTPHLIKTARNCLANSGSHKKSRSLWNNGKHIAWMHLVELYRDHCENRELSVLPNLTRNHIDLTAFSTMRVSLAAEIMRFGMPLSAVELQTESFAATHKFGIKHK